MPPRDADGDRRLALAVIPALVLPFFASLFYFVLLADHWTARVLYTATKAFTVVWPVVATRWILRRPLPVPVPGAPRHRRALPLGVLSGLAIVGLILLLRQTPLGELLVEAGPRIRLKAIQLGVLEHYWPFALVLSLVHSLIEEVYWRWFVYGRLRDKLAPGAAMLLASAAFASHHVVVASQFFPLPWALLFGASVGVGGALWCWMLEHQRTLAGAWISHVLADLGIFWVGFTLLRS